MVQTWAEIKPFYGGSEFYLFKYERYNDVRLVGTPPESIGKYGGDTDNWMWPRHTGDLLYLEYTLIVRESPLIIPKTIFPWYLSTTFPSLLMV